MKILVSNDDGILAEGLWALVRELKKIAEVIVVAPELERSALGTAVSLRQTLRVRKVEPVVPGVKTYAVDGTPSDSVILALDHLAKSKVDLVISGINHGFNLGDDVHISGTVGAALQGYLHGFPALAISTARDNSLHLDTAAKLAAWLATRISSDSLKSNVFLNVNLPNLPLEGIGEAQITRLASQSHINTVEEDDDDDTGKYYRLIRQRLSEVTDKQTDTWVVEQGNISITPLHINLANKTLPPILDNLCADLLQELRNY